MISYVLYISVIESGDNANLVRNRKFLPETNTGGNYKHIFDNLLMHVYNLPVSKQANEPSLAYYDFRVQNDVPFVISPICFLRLFMFYLYYLYYLHILVSNTISISDDVLVL